MLKPESGELAAAGPATPARPERSRRIPTRFLVLGLLFVITVVNYADRSSLSITGTSVRETLGFSAVQLGYIFSAFSWAYVVAQLPGGMLLDRFGARRVYAGSLALWTLATAATSLAGLITTRVVIALVVMFALRLLLGVFESPAFPANARVATIWFPTAERGQATAVFNSGQYFATVLFAPIMAWVTHEFGWRWVFVLLGALGLALAIVWWGWMYPPREHGRVTPGEVEAMSSGGALVDMDATPATARTRVDRRMLGRVLATRPLWGISVFQYAVNSLSYFFITWFPIYLTQARHISLVHAGFIAALPALAAFIGGLFGGFVSDFLLRRGVSLTLARKAPAAIGLLLGTVIAVANFTDSTTVIVMIMTTAFFGKGMGSLGWAITTDVAPTEAASIFSSLTNGLGNIAGIITPIVIGYIVQTTGSFNVALWFVAAHGILAVLALIGMGPIRRLSFTDRTEVSA
ncbi:MFS transporter [Nocardia macrotermitis]|uniref:Putative glucarate transporter n=1 Tax=Nocardia macrotermitis TaxID=2585198 RepID=A0A7K0D574_9NOCA|nr:MFS transporter [Nocardia macrotermitis]MQY20878.1 putative glucarate transporter [Nocardia macrotermitis]